MAINDDEWDETLVLVKRIVEHPELPIPEGAARELAHFIDEMLGMFKRAMAETVEASPN